LAVLAQACVWALPSPELVAAFDAAQAMVVELNAVLLRLVREIDARGIAKGEGASSTAVWIRNRYRVSIRYAHRLVKTAAEVHAAPPVVGAAMAAGAVNADQVAVILRSLAQLPRDLGTDVRGRAAAALVDFCAEHDPAQLTVIGNRILHVVAPRRGRGRRAGGVGAGRGDRGGEAVRHPVPAPRRDRRPARGSVVRCGGGGGAGGDRTTPHPDPGR
jgi:hypothetical protein